MYTLKFIRDLARSIILPIILSVPTNFRKYFLTQNNTDAREKKSGSQMIFYNNPSKLIIHE